jgi:uncharacterized repeat protein (TIGR03803 family)
MKRTSLYAVPLSAIVLIVIVAAPASAATEKVLFAFNNNDGSTPAGGVIFDASGNLYGTTISGGGSTKACDSGCGLVFKLSPTAEGHWTQTIIHRFQGTDGLGPSGNLAFDAAGNLYGTTGYGGAYNNGGTVFELTPGANGEWKESVLHSFGGTGDGATPLAGVIFDQAGNMYGTTLSGGVSNDYCSASQVSCGTVFRLSPSGDGKWAETVLFRFNGHDGANPFAGVSLSASGELFGTTAAGGICDVPCGTAFRLTPRSHGEWTHQLLYKFNGANHGAIPVANLIADANGNWYGTTRYGGSGGCDGAGCGLVFKLSQGHDGDWVETTLYIFTDYEEGDVPSQLLLGASGELMGVTTSNIFRLTGGEDGKWTETVIWNFNQQDGWGPNDVVRDAKGNLYGTAFSGGNEHACGGGCGVVFELTP